MPNIQVKRGSATSALPDRTHGVVIAHIANNIGAWGAGFVLALDQLSSVPRAAYMGLAKDNGGAGPRQPADIPIGTWQWVEVKPGLIVSNMIAQRGISRTSANPVLVDYDALRKCLRATFHRAVRLGYHVNMPNRMGAGLAGGDQATIHRIIKETAEEVEQSEIARKLGATLTIVLWEFEDASARSYVAKGSAPVADQPSIDTVEDTGDQRTLTAPPDDIADLG